MQGPVLQPFSYDPAHPYTAGQHRGIDIGARAGETVVAPTAGTVSFAGTVPTSGRSVTIQTADGYSVTLTHLGTVLVAKGATLAEQDAVGTVGPSGTPEVEGPYVHLGIRVTAEPDGYVDPLGYLPVPAAGGGGDGSTSPQPGAGSGSAATGGTPASNAGSPSTTPREPAAPNRGRNEKSQTRADESRPDVRPQRSSQRPAAAHPNAQPAHRLHLATTRRHSDVPATSSRRPVVETAVPAEPLGLGAGHEIRPSAATRAQETARRQAPTSLLPSVLNGAAALVALAAALVAARGRRRRRAQTGAVAAAQILPLPRRPAERPAARAA